MVSISNLGWKASMASIRLHTSTLLILFISIKLSNIQETQQASSDEWLTLLFSLHSSYMTSCHLGIQLAAWTVTSAPQSTDRYLHCSTATGPLFSSKCLNVRQMRAGHRGTRRTLGWPGGRQTSGLEREEKWGAETELLFSQAVPTLSLELSLPLLG